jgi:HD superfamily phosphohydrolase
LNKIKILNDPVYGFIRIPRDLVFNLIEHPYFQRLRRIKQLGLTHMVYPGALHTRFHHALGALHLLSMALETLKMKDVDISDEEAEAASIAILLHDAGHGPFSHALENILAPGIHHEELSLFFMESLNKEFDGKLSLAIEIFNGTYKKKFLHQLISSQLDVDRLDYLRRDSFYTGVYEGVIGSDRIIMMMNVVNNELVVEEKGIYSIEKFLLARRFMYWQVYLHKTVVSAEQLLIKILQRAKYLAAKGEDLFATPAFHYFLYNQINRHSFQSDSKVLDTFASLDDYDIIASIKSWITHSDIILSTLCKKMINRELNKIEFHKHPFPEEKINNLRETVSYKYSIPADQAHYFVFTDVVENSAYSAESIKINILMKDGAVLDIAEASDQYDLGTLSKNVKKYFICYPKQVS